MSNPCSQRPGDPSSSKCVSLLPNGLVSLEETPNHLIPIAAANAVMSPLLRLPAELRAEIFRYATGGHRIYVYCYPRLGGGESLYSVWRWTGSWNRVGRLALSRVCRQIYSETALMAYANNTFCFPDKKNLRCWIDACNVAQLSAVKSIQLHYRGLHSYRGRLSETFPNLKLLVVTEGLEYPISPGDQSSYYSGIRHVIEVEKKMDFKVVIERIVYEEKEKRPILTRSPVHGFQEQWSEDECWRF